MSALPGWTARAGVCGRKMPKGVICSCGRSLADVLESLQNYFSTNYATAPCLQEAAGAELNCRALPDMLPSLDLNHGGPYSTCSSLALARGQPG